jgi:hypothetical protein
MLSLKHPIARTYNGRLSNGVLLCPYCVRKQDEPD